MKIADAPGATPLDEDTLQGLLPNLTTQGELNEFEAKNISDALIWASKSRALKKDLLSVSGLVLLHKKMFDQTWKWAGTFRKRDTNTGVDPKRIQSDLAILLGDVKFWIEKKTFDMDEIALRFHHRLVWIHPFPNGNGRFSRMAADLLLTFHGRSKFVWGSSSLSGISEARDQYLKALRKADTEGSYTDLMKFAKG